MKRYVISVATDKQFLSAQKNIDRFNEAIEYAKELVEQCLLGGDSEDSVINISITKQTTY